MRNCDNKNEITLNCVQDTVWKYVGEVSPYILLDNTPTLG